MNFLWIQVTLAQGMRLWKNGISRMSFFESLSLIPKWETFYISSIFPAATLDECFGSMSFFISSLFTLFDVAVADKLLTIPHSTSNSIWELLPPLFSFLTGSYTMLKKRSYLTTPYIFSCCLLPSPFCCSLSKSQTKFLLSPTTVSVK